MYNDLQQVFYDFMNGMLGTFVHYFGAFILLMLALVVFYIGLRLIKDGK